MTTTCFAQDESNEFEVTLDDVEVLDTNYNYLNAIGYDNAAKIAKTALKNNTTLKHETLKTGLINKKDYEKIVDPKKMIYPA